MAEDDLRKAIKILEYGLARRGLYLTVHALNKAKEVLDWELARDREKALEAVISNPWKEVRSNGCGPMSKDRTHNVS